MTKGSPITTKATGKPVPTPGDAVGHVEIHGIDPIADSERHGSPRELFFIWFAANISYLFLVYGGIFAISGANLAQAALVAACATAVSFALVALLSKAGVSSGAPTLTISRAAFGPCGNLGPVVMSWVNALGWEIIGAVLATDAVLDVLKVLHLPASGPLVTAVCLLVVVLVVGSAGFLGHATIVWWQGVATVVLGLLSLGVGVFLLLRTNWGVVLATPAGPWGSTVLPLLSFALAGLGLTWVTAAADYTRYLPRTSTLASLLLWTVSGATIAAVPMILLGFLLTSAVPGMPTAADPVAVIGAALPAWMALPYLLAVIGGWIAALVIGLYSSGLTLLSGLTVFGINVARAKTAWIDGAVMLLGGGFLLLVAQSFVGPFESFLQLITVLFMAWSAIFLVDMVERWFRRKPYDEIGLGDTGPGGAYYYRAGVHWVAATCWLIGIVVGLLFTSSPFFTGPLARSGFFNTTSCGYALGFVASAVCYAAYTLAVRADRRHVPDEL